MIRVAIISHSLWQQRGADPSMLGRPVQVNGEQFTVVGVAPKGFTGTSIPGPEVWLPLGAHDTFRQGRHAGRARVRRARGARVERGGAAPSWHLGRDASRRRSPPLARRLEQAFPAVNAGYTLEMSKPSRLMFMPGPGSGAVTATLALP